MLKHTDVLMKILRVALNRSRMN